MYDVLYLENEAGYILGNLNATSEGYYFAWDEDKNEIIYVMDDLTTVYYPEDYTLNPSVCWITVGTAEEAAIVSGKGYNLALENNFDETITLSNVVSVDTLGFTCKGVNFDGVDSTTQTTAYMIGSFGTISGDIAKSTIVQSGSATNVSVSGAAGSSVKVNGTVSTFSANVASSSISALGNVSTISTSASVENNGIVGTVSAGANVINKGKVSTAAEGTVTGANQTVTIAASSKEDLDNIRTQIYAGNRTFKGEKIELSNDINMNGISFTPISNFSRDNGDTSKFFAGEFDGKGHTIYNLANKGFSVTGLSAGTNNSTPYFNNVLYKEAIYGLFASVYNATIRNVNVTCDIDMVVDATTSFVGDSVGGIIGYAYGDYVRVYDCTVSGTIKGYDGVGGIIGRCYAKEITLENCTNNATISAVLKCGGLVGFCDTNKKPIQTSDDVTITFTNCKNNGSITSLGIEKDNDLQFTGESAGGTVVELGSLNDAGYYAKNNTNNGRYRAAAFAVINGRNSSNDHKFYLNIDSTCANSGNVYIGMNVVEDFGTTNLVRVSGGCYYNSTTTITQNTNDFWITKE